jgi:Nucleotidyltransferase domain
MDRLGVVEGLDPGLAARVVERIRELEPSTIAVIVFGSYAKGRADTDSDLDVHVVTGNEPASPYRMWFEERPGEKPLHVSPSVKSVPAWLAQRNKPQGWALGFAAEHVCRYLWATGSARARLGEDPSCVHPPAEPELEDFVSYLSKIKRAAAGEDWPIARVYAHQAALLAPGLLRTLNGEIAVRDRREAIAAALALEVAPEHYRADLTVSLGLVEASDDEVVQAALRLGRELLAFLRVRDPNADPQPDIARYLGDGTLERHAGFDVEGP